MDAQVRVMVDPELCAGMAECVRLAPDAFRVDELRGTSEVLPGARIVSLERLHEAVAECPTQAISVAFPNAPETAALR